MSAVITAIRLRPETGTDDSWFRLNENTIIREEQNNSTKKVTFDYVYDNHSNADVYEGSCQKMVNSILDGYNVTIAAYGQSGSGKTHSIFGNDEENGVASLAVQHLLESISKRASVQYIVKMSCFEIYNEKLQDLLDPDTSKTCKVIEDRVYGAIEEHISSYKQFCQISSRAQQRRQAGETVLNKKSSRSHAVWQLVVESLECDVITGHQMTTCSRLLILDLAGSENTRLSMSKQQATESKRINLSLLALSKLISTIADDSNAQKFLTFRESILTRILRPAIGGNSKLFLLCCIRRQNCPETSSTISFCSKAKLIRNDAKRNEEVKNAELPKLLEEITILRNQLKERQQTEEDERKNRLDRLLQLVLNSNDANDEIENKPKLSVNMKKARRRHSISTFGTNHRTPIRDVFIDDFKTSMFSLKEDEEIEFQKLDSSTESGRSSRASCISDSTLPSRPSSPVETIVKSCETQTEQLMVEKEVYDQLKIELQSMKKCFNELQEELQKNQNNDQIILDLRTLLDKNADEMKNVQNSLKEQKMENEKLKKQIEELKFETFEKDNIVAKEKEVVAEAEKSKTNYKKKLNAQIDKYEDLKKRGLEMLKVEKEHKEEAMKQVAELKQKLEIELKERRSIEESYLKGKQLWNQKQKELAQMNEIIQKAREEEEMMSEKMRKINEKLNEEKEMRHIADEKMAEMQIKMVTRNVNFINENSGKCFNKTHLLLEIDVDLMKRHKELLIERLNRRRLES